MARWLAWFFTSLILLQSFSQEVLVLSYQANQARITRLFCVNKAQPQLHCNGKCHLARQLRRSSQPEGSAPSLAKAKIKLEALPWPPALRPRLAAPRGPQLRAWPAQLVPAYAFTYAGRLLRPPLLLQA
jgi:hypothetical protein